MKQKDEQQLWDLLLKDDMPNLANQKPLPESGDGKEWGYGHNYGFFHSYQAYLAYRSIFKNCNQKNKQPIAKSGNGKITFKDSKNCDQDCSSCSNILC